MNRRLGCCTPPSLRGRLHGATPSSQTKCNTFIGCCDGNQVHSAHHRRPLPHCLSSRARVFGPANSQQLWIARHRPLLERSSAPPDARSATDRHTPTSRPGPGGGKRSKLERDESLRSAVLERLKQGWSPEQIAGRLARDQAEPSISHETIYRFIYAQIARTNDFSWRRYLPRAKSKRGRRGTRGGSPVSFIEGRIPLSERPAEARDRQTPGHWEADLMMFAKYGQAILTLHERSSPHPPRCQARQQDRQSHRPVDRAIAPPHPLTAAPDNDLRQWHRVRAPHPPPQPRSPNLLLRSLRPLAKRRNRKRHRQNATAHPTQNRSSYYLEKPLHCSSASLQRNAQKMPRLQDTRRAIPPPPVVTSDASMSDPSVGGTRRSVTQLRRPGISPGLVNQLRRLASGGGAAIPRVARRARPVSLDSASASANVSRM